MATQQGLPVEEEQRLVERARRFYEDELLEQLISEHKGDIVAIDGCTLEYAVGFNASEAHQELEQKCDKPVFYTARIGYDYVYSVSLPVSVLSGKSK